MESSHRDIFSLILTLFAVLSLMFASFICQDGSLKSIVYALIVCSLIIVNDNIKEIKNK